MTNIIDLLLCMHIIPLQRHTQATKSFAKHIRSSNLVQILLEMLEDGDEGGSINSINSNLSADGVVLTTKLHTAQLLSVLAGKGDIKSFLYIPNLQSY